MKGKVGTIKSPQDEMVIPSDLSRLPEVEKFVIKICENANLDDDQSDNLAIAITELVNNAIIHGNRQDPKKQVVIQVAYKRDQIQVSVIDEGTGFNPAQIANPTDPQNLWKQNGRGIFLVRNLIDKVEIKVSSEGTEVLITEYLPQNLEN